ncbi:MAG: leucine-rich repeat protein [Christensenellaceae bacterium]|nr:leucine-rich repeat protein [Christensenellaceae bacterium]
MRRYLKRALLPSFLIICMMSFFAACIEKEYPIDPQTYIVEFNSTGGSYVAPIKSDPETGKITRPVDPIKDGYIFYSWYEYSPGETEWHYRYIEDNGWNDWYSAYGHHGSLAFDFDIKWGSDRKVYAVWKPGPTDAIVLEEPIASNVQIGESTAKSRLTGKFNVEGDLHFVGETRTLMFKGTVVCEWEFVPYNSEFYNKIMGTVEVKFCENKIRFETDGGLDPGDICFDESYTISEKILTAKNDYHFDGWTKIKGSNDSLQYPQTITTSIVLYAQYTAHTEDKLRYQLHEDGVSVFAKHNDFRVSGEIVIADMYEGRFVTSIVNFRETEITKIVFSNYTKNIAMAFKDCYYLTDIYIPNSVKWLASEAFLRCYGLRSVVFEDSSEELEIGTAIFAYCRALEEVTLSRLTRISEWMFSSCESLQTILIPGRVQEISFHAFSGCGRLSDIIFEGDKLEKIEPFAFGGCRNLDSVTLPQNVRISPDTFVLVKFSNLEITDEQINWIAQDLHNNFIGFNADFKVNIERGSQYAGDNIEGQYVANTESINLRFDVFSVRVLDALLHEFFHHYQYVLTIGIGDENYNTVPNYVNAYNYGRSSDTPVTIVKKDDWEERIEQCISLNVDYLLIEETTIAEWLQPYIPLLPDQSNWDQYWNQPIEAHARMFASWFTGFLWW